MSRTAVLQDSYANGERSDGPRTRVSRAGVWRLYDFIPQTIGGPLRKRGGWTNAHPGSMAGTSALNVIYHEFPGGPQLLAQSSTGDVYRVTAGGLVNTGAGASADPKNYLSREPGVFRDNVIYFDRTRTPIYWNGSAWFGMTGAPSGGEQGGTFKEFFVIPVGNRLYFSLPGDPFSAWPLDVSWVDAPFPIYTVAPLRNQILLFGRSRTHRVRGTTPPSQYSRGDFVSEPLWQLGCPDMRSLAYYGDQLIFCNPQGVWLTDGTTLENLCEGGGVIRAWLDQTEAYDPATWIIAADMMSGHLFISLNSSTGPVGAWMVNVAKRVWTRITNLRASGFATRRDSGEQAYFSRLDGPGIGSLASIFHPDATNMADGNGVVVLPRLDTPNYQDRPGRKRWKELYVNYELNGSDPTLGLNVLYGSEPSAELNEYAKFLGKLPASSIRRKAVLPIRDDAEGAQFALGQVGPSAETILYELEASLWPLEQSRYR